VGVHAAEFSGAPHLIGVKLVWTSEFVAIRLVVDTFVEGVPGLKAKLFVPLGLHAVAHRKQLNVLNSCHDLLNYNLFK
jgi:hypothetical protein